MARLRLGEILIKSGVINEEQLKRALRVQEQTGCLLGEALVNGGFTTDEAITMAVSKQLGVPYASRENQILKPEKGQNLGKIVSEKFSRDQMVLPLFMEDDTLAMAMVDPTNALVLDNLRIMTGCEIQPFIASKSQLLKAVDEFYQAGDTSLIDRVMERPAVEGGGLDMDVNVSEEVLDLDKVMAEARGASVVALASAVMKQAISERASDVHLELYDERASLKFRIDGKLYERTPPAKSAVAAFISRIKILSRLDIAERRVPQDGAYSLKYQNRKVDVRVSTLPTVFGEKLVMRILDKGGAVKDVARLGFDKKQMDDFLEMARYPYGLIFLTGPTGSGKTTTLYAVLQAVYTAEKNFMTIEDPVEYKLPGINQCQVKPAIGLTYSAAMRSFLRQDPDVILVGEVRDPETAETCLRAALTGHLVLSTLHTNDALGAVPRLTDMGIEPYLLSNSLLLTAGQRLVRVLCPACKVPYKPERAVLERVIKEALVRPPKNPESVVLYKSKGCPKCTHTGFSGRRAIYEIYPINQEMRGIIYKDQDVTKLREISVRNGVADMRASGLRKVLAGETTVEEVLSITMEE